LLVRQRAVATCRQGLPVMDCSLLIGRRVRRAEELKRADPAVKRRTRGATGRATYYKAFLTRRSLLKCATRGCATGASGCKQTHRGNQPDQGMCGIPEVPGGERYPFPRGVSLLFPKRVNANKCAARRHKLARHAEANHRLPWPRIGPESVTGWTFRAIDEHGLCATMYYRSQPRCKSHRRLVMDAASLLAISSSGVDL
jgi:hypothetical protein